MKKKKHVLIFKQLVSIFIDNYSIDYYKIRATTEMLPPTFLDAYYKPDPILNDWHHFISFLTTVKAVALPTPQIRTLKC